MELEIHRLARRGVEGAAVTTGLGAECGTCETRLKLVLKEKKEAEDGARNELETLEQGAEVKVTSERKKMELGAKDEVTTEPKIESTFGAMDEMRLGRGAGAEAEGGAGARLAGGAGARLAGGAGAGARLAGGAGAEARLAGEAAAGARFAGEVAAEVFDGDPEVAAEETGNHPELQGSTRETGRKFEI